MNDELPEDLSRWPEDPFAILGVDRAVDARQLRRAYAARIRRFKPEHHPEHFRRIRAAYEFLVQFVDRGAWRTPPEAVPAPHFQDSDPEDDEASAAPPDFEEPLDALWNEACRGDRAVAYQQLIRLAHQYPQREAVYVRLFWLLTLQPQLDPARNPAAWLVRGLQETSLNSRLLLDLYLGEMEDFPEEAFSPQCNALLDCPGPTHAYRDLLIRRWQNAGAAGRWSILEQDLERAVRRGLGHQVSVWSELLMAAMDQLAWSDTPDGLKLFAHCRKEADRCAEEYLPLHHTLARYDLLADLSDLYRKVPHLTRFPSGLAFPLRNVLRSWNCPSDVVRQRFLEFLAPMMDDLAHGLLALDQIAEAARPALQYLCDLVAGMYREVQPDVDVADPQALEFDLLDLLHWLVDGTYANVRLRVVRLCHAAGISCGRLIEILLATPHPCALGDCQLNRDQTMLHLHWANQSTTGPHQVLAEKLLKDAPLHFLAQAHPVFWR